MDAAAELSPEWKEEIRRRCEDLDRGLVELRDAEDVFSKAFASLDMGNGVLNHG